MSLAQHGNAAVCIWMRNALAHVGKAQQSMAAAALRQDFLQPNQEAARQIWCHVADQLRSRWPKLGKLIDDTEEDVLAYMAFPPQHGTKLHSTSPLERLNKEVKRRADVVGIFPSEASISRLIGAVLRAMTNGRCSTATWASRPWARCSTSRLPTKPCNFHPKPPEPWPPQAHQKFPPPPRTLPPNLLCETSTSTCRGFATISSDVCFFRDISASSIRLKSLLQEDHFQEADHIAGPTPSSSPP